jgi:hypothetical protein
MNRSSFGITNARIVCTLVIRKDTPEGPDELTSEMIIQLSPEDILSLPDSLLPKFVVESRKITDA